jgi:hypothetical protein
LTTYNHSTQNIALKHWRVCNRKHYQSWAFWESDKVCNDPHWLQIFRWNGPA